MWIAAFRQSIKYLNVASNRLLDPKKQTKQGCFPRSIWADYRYELAVVYSKIGVLLNDVVLVSGRQVFNCNNVRIFCVHLSFP